MPNGKPVSELTLRRLPLYLFEMRRLKGFGNDVTSAAELARNLGIHHTQIRKDLAVTGIVGRAKVGHIIDEAMAAIERFLGWDRTLDAFLVGAGNLGSALAGYAELVNGGTQIVALFDDHPQKIGRVIHGIPVFDVADLSYHALRLQPSLGIITTPAKAAKITCDRLVEAGIRAIWNFTPYQIIPEKDGLIVENTCLCSSLGVLTWNMNRAAPLTGGLMESKSLIQE